MQNQATTPEMLNEGVWSKTKYWVGKLGRLEKGGKIIGRGKQSAAAAKQVADLIEKEANTYLKQLDVYVKQHYPEYPNMESHDVFLNGLDCYGYFYDSILAATKQNPETGQFLPAVMANAIITDLRILLKHDLDYNLSTVYQTMNESEELDENGTLKNSQAAAQAAPHSNVISGHQNDSTTMGTLKSNKLPILLATLGSSLGAFGWLLKTPFMQDWLNHLFDHTKDIAGYVNSNEVIGAVGNGEGITQTLSRLYPGVDLTPGAPVENFHSVLKQIGGGNEEGGLKAISHLLKNPNKIGELKQMLGSGKFHHMKDLFNQHAGDVTSGKGGSWYETIKDAKLSANIKTQIIKTVVTQGVKAGAIGAGLGSFLAPLGIALVAAGVATKLLRMKGQKSSRAQIMNDLLQEMELVPLTDPGSISMKLLGAGTQETGMAVTNKETGVAATNQETGMATTNPETGVGAANQQQNPQRNAVGPRKSGFNSDASDIEDAQIVSDDPETGAEVVDDKQKALGAGQQQQQPGQPQGAAGRGPDGAPAVPAVNNLLNRLNPASNKKAEANLKAFGETITTADNRSADDITDEIDILKASLNDIPAKQIAPRVTKMVKALKSNDPNLQLPVLKALQTLPAQIKNWYVQAMQQYSPDTATMLKSDMAYTADGGLKKKAGNAQQQMPLNEGYTTPLFGLEPDKNALIMGSLASVGPKLVRLVQSGQPLSKEQVNYVVQKLYSGSFKQTRKVGQEPDKGVVQKVIIAINGWLLIRISDYQNYLKHLTESGAGPATAVKGQPAPAAKGAELGEPVPMKENMNPFRRKSPVPLQEGGSKVSWKYGTGTATGKIESTHKEPITRTIKGSVIKRNGSPEDPALVIVQDDGSRVIKLRSELSGSLKEGVNPFRRTQTGK